MSSPADQIADILREHVGRDQIISSREIAAQLGLPPDGRTVRSIIADEDWEDREMLVVAIPGIGYYVANDIAEADAYHMLLCMLRDRATTKLRKFRALTERLGIHLSKL